MRMFSTWRLPSGLSVSKGETRQPFFQRNDPRLRPVQLGPLDSLLASHPGNVCRPRASSLPSLPSQVNSPAPLTLTTLDTIDPAPRALVDSPHAACPAPRPT